jgi:hypothetical protein
LGIILSVPAVAPAGNWPGWRGPTGCGTTDAKDLSLQWDGKTGEGVVWKAKIPGLGHSSPIVWGDRVFVTAAVAQTPEEEKNKQIPDDLFACYQASDGKLLWTTHVAPGQLVAYMGALRGAHAGYRREICLSTASATLSICASVFPKFGLSRDPTSVQFP